MNILIVEDNDLNRRLVRALLASRGHTLEEAHTAAEALAALERGAPDVVLLDINIPGGGLAVAEQICRSPALSRTTVIAHTALAMRGDRERFLAAGCHGYISKPIDVKTFAAEIEAIVRGRS